MASYTTNEFKSGLKILLDNEPFAIVENEMVKPGKGKAFNRVRVRNLKTGREEELHRELVDLANSKNQATNGGTSIPATFMRVTVKL